MDNSLQHAGVKGMKWGIRRYQNKDGSLTPAGRKRYSEGSSKTGIDKEAVKQKAKQAALKGAKTSAKVIGKIGKVYLTDQLVFGGAGTKAAKTTIKYTGRAAVTAYTMARGGYDIRWYDN